MCHLRDTEEAFGARMEQILAMDIEPKLIPTDPARWAEERQYLATDVALALAAFRRRRRDPHGVRAARPGPVDKAGIHPVAGRVTIDGFLNVMAWHDDDHLAQLARALDGRA